MLVLSFNLAITAEIEPFAQNALISRTNYPELVLAACTNNLVQLDLYLFLRCHSNFLRLRNDPGSSHIHSLLKYSRDLPN